MFLKFKSALFIIAIMTCTLTSCVEDERNPFENSGYGQGESFDVKLPGEGTFYVGSEIELRGSGFTSGDEIYVSDYINSSELVEARVVRYTSDKLFFIMPDSVLEYGNGDVEVLLRRNTVSHRLGTLYVSIFDITTWYANDDPYCDVVLFTNSEFDYASNGKAYYQEIDENSEELLGEPLEVEVEHFGEEYNNLQGFRVYPTSYSYVVFYEYNGEFAMSQSLWKMCAPLDFSIDCNLGESVRIDWRGFRTGDKILLMLWGDVVATIDPVIDENGATFVVPRELESGMSHDMLLQRYDNYTTHIGYLNINY